MCDLPAGRRLRGGGVAARVGLCAGFGGLLCRHLPEWHGVLDPVRVWVASPIAIVGLRFDTTFCVATGRTACAPPCV